MKRLLLPLIAALALPTNLIASEKVNLTEADVSEISANAMFTGSLLTLCYGLEKGYITKEQRQSMLAYNLSLYNALHKNEAIKKEDQTLVLGKVLNIFPNCFPEVKRDK